MHINVMLALLAVAGSGSVLASGLVVFSPDALRAVASRPSDQRRKDTRLGESADRVETYCRETEVPCMKAWISSRVRRPSLLGRALEAHQGTGVFKLLLSDLIAG